ncbi:hypothetical protein SAMN05446037_1006150 [Anaerovirgula multivorans]|uniref:Uncharacterized protein n=1 Tax=Anaerovirgula multivorans TaxID=312168 RepID=A0A239CV73_9FIRM|nr:hypothetical protein [Anaerovirgula multivorans]SNS23561.1 hypothetical protein SAMN05446037_1006150 [Anaerovirgula multivorans]
MIAMSKAEAVEKGLPTYNEGAHKLIDVSDNSTLILLMPNGVYVTVASIGNVGADWACLDIKVQSSTTQRIVAEKMIDLLDGTYSLDINVI